MKHPLLCLLLALFLAPGYSSATDWPQIRGNSEYTAYAPVGIYGNLAVLWSVPAYFGHVVVAGGRIYQTSVASSLLAARSVYFGATLWEDSILGGITTSQPAVDGGTVFIATADDTVTYQAFDITTGERIWSAWSQWWDYPTFLSGDHEVSISEMSDGNKTVNYYSDTVSNGPVESTFSIYEMRYAKDGSFYANRTNWWNPWDVFIPQLSLFRHVPFDGEMVTWFGPWAPANYSDECMVGVLEKWTSKTSGTWENWQDGGPVMALPGAVLCLSVDQTRLSAANPWPWENVDACAPKSREWYSPKLGPLTRNMVAAGEGRIAAITSVTGYKDSATVYILDASGGTLKKEAWIGAATTGPTIATGIVLYGDAKGVVHVRDWDTLKEKQSVTVAGVPITGDVVVTDYGVYVTAADGTISCLVAMGDGCHVASVGNAQNGAQEIGLGGVNTLSGNVYFSSKDISIPFGGMSISISRTYNSQRSISASMFTEDGTVGTDRPVYYGLPARTTLGPGWKHSYEVSVRPQYDPASGATLYVEDRGDGRQLGFTHTLTGATARPAGLHEDFSFTVTGSVLSATVTGVGTSLRTKRGMAKVFDPAGNLLSMTEPNGNRLVFGYQPAQKYCSTAGGACLTSITYLSATSLEGGLPQSATVYLDYDSLARLWKISYSNPSGSDLLEWKYSYDSAGCLAEAAGPSGVKSSYKYDSENRMVERNDPRGPAGSKRLMYAYDGKGRAKEIRSPSGILVAAYDYSSLPNGQHQTRVTQPAAGGNSKVTLYTYAECRALLRVDECRTGSRDSSWDGDFNRTEVVDANGGSTKSQYDQYGNPVQVMNAEGKTSYREYDPVYSQITHQTDEKGNESFYNYDERGNLLSSVQKVAAIPELGEGATEYVTTREYDARGQLVALTDARGARTHYEYDNAGNLLSTTQFLDLPDGDGARAITNRYEYDIFGRRVAQMDARGVRTEYQYDLENRLVKVRYAALLGGTALAETTHEYDELGREKKVTDGSGRFVMKSYDDRDRVMAISDALGLRTAYTYDDAGNVIEERDGKGNKTTFEYDTGCRLSKVTDGEGGTVQLSYDAAGNLIGMTDPNGHETRYEYDLMKRRTKVIHPDSTVEETKYDPVGNVASRTDESGVDTVFLYDSLNRLRRVTYQDGGKTPGATYWYDPAGNRVKASTLIPTPDGPVPYEVLASHDSLSRLTREDIEGLALKEIEYDDSGNRTLLRIVPQSGSLTATAMGEHEIRYSYDPIGRLSAIENRGLVTSYVYEPGCGSCGGGGKPVGIKRPNGISTSMEYDQAGQLLNLRNYKEKTGVAWSFCRYTYDLARNRDSMRDVSGLWAYEYDKLNRLTKATHPLWPDQSYTYDHAGNRTEMTVEGSAAVDTYSYNNLDELTTLNTAGRDSYSYEWDARGNLNAITGGNKGTEYTFDTANRLRQAVSETGTKYFGYDSSGQRVYESMGRKDTWFIFDGLDTVMELDGAKTPKAAIVPGICKTRLDLPEPFTEWYLRDGLGSVVQLTDAWGNLTQEYWYEPFGRLQKGVKDPNNRYRYVGLGSDDDLGLVYMNARWYGSAVGRFLSSDPEEADIVRSQRVNGFTYALGNPIRYVDPRGLKALSYDEIASIVASNNASGQGDCLIICMAYAESDFRPDVVNRKGKYTARGLMQVTERAAEDVGVDPEDLLDPDTNVYAGSSYLGLLMERWKDLRTAIGRYCGGCTYIEHVLKCELCLNEGKEWKECKWK